MRTLLIAAIFVLLGVFLLSYNQGSAASLPPRSELIKNPNKLISETLKQGVTGYDFLKNLKKIRTFFDFESFFKKQAVHNPFVFRQGGSYAPNPVVTGYPIVGPPFDIHTPTGVIPGCLNLLCPPPQGALWYAGTCWCTP